MWCIVELSLVVDLLIVRRQLVETIKQVAARLAELVDHHQKKKEKEKKKKKKKLKCANQAGRHESVAPLELRCEEEN